MNECVVFLDQDCEVGEWGAWTSCTKACGGGKTTRSRKVVQVPTGTGKACPHLYEEEDCNQHTCGVSLSLSSLQLPLTKWSA